MRWALVRPCNHSPYYDPEIQEPLGLEYLSAFRRCRGDSVLVLDSALDGATDTRLARRVASFAPDIVGFSVMTAHEAESVRSIHAESARLLEGSRVAFAAGGNFVSTEPANAARLLPEGLALVQYEGELASDRLAQQWQESSNGSGTLLAGPSFPDLDSLPFPDRPFSDRILGGGWAFSIQGSRGCCGNCVHCASPGMSDRTKSRWRGRSPENIVEEIAALHARYGASSFNFIDEDFLGPNHLAEDRATRFANELSRRRLPISFGIQVRPDSLSDHTIDTLAAVGLTYVFLGIESDDPSDFRRWRRPWTPDPFASVDRLRSRGVEVNAGVMLFHSHSTFEGIRRFARKLSEHGLLDYRSAINRQDAMPGSDLHRRAAAAGWIDPAVSGPQPVPYIHEGINAFHTDVAYALGPLGPPSMAAICALPPLWAKRFLDPQSEPACRELNRIITSLDRAVTSSFFAVLDLHQSLEGRSGLVSELRQRNLDTALAGARELVDSGFSPSFDALRQAIREDTGL